MPDELYPDSPIGGGVYCHVAFSDQKNTNPEGPSRGDLSVSLSAKVKFVGCYFVGVNFPYCLSQTKELKYGKMCTYVRLNQCRYLLT